MNTNNIRQSESERQSQFVSEAIALFISALQDLEKAGDKLPSKLEEVTDKDKSILGDCNNAIIQLRVASGFVKKQSEISKSQIAKTLLEWYGERGGSKKSLVDYFFCEFLKKAFEIDTSKLAIIHGIKPSSENLNDLASMTVNEIASVDNQNKVFKLSEREGKNDILKGIERLLILDKALFKALSDRVESIKEYEPKKLISKSLILENDLDKENSKTKEKTIIDPKKTEVEKVKEKSSKSKSKK